MSDIDKVTAGKSGADGFIAVWNDGHAADETVTAWLDNELSARDRTEVSAHVTSCSACTTLELEARVLRSSASQLLRSVDVPEASAVTTDRIRFAAREKLPRHSAGRVTTTLLAERNADVGASSRRAGFSPITPIASKRTTWRTRTAVRFVTGFALATGGLLFAMTRNGITIMPTQAVLPDTPRVVRVPLPAEVNNATSGLVAANNQTVRTMNDSSGGSASINGALSPITGKPAMQTRFVVRGVVHSPGRGGSMVGVPRATVFIPDTDISTTTDSAGQFVLNNVPESATVVSMRAIGLTDGSAPLNFRAGDTATVSIATRGKVLELNAVVVSAADTTVSVPVMRCLMLTGAQDAKRPPIFTVLLGHVDLTGRFFMGVANWPQRRVTTTVAFTRGLDGLLRGSTQGPKARLAMNLKEVGALFTGTVTEQRGTITRTDTVTLRPEWSQSRCDP